MTIHSASFDLKNDVKITIPSDLCCNCAATTGISSVSTKLKRTRFMLLAGTEITLTVSLPYCGACLSTAKRHPVGVGSKVLMGCLLFFAVLIAWQFVPLSLSRRIPEVLTLPALLTISIGIIFAVYSLFRPKGQQTSYFQPIRLKKVRQKFTGEIVGYVLAFTNPTYERRFTAENQTALSKKLIELESA